MPLLSLSMNHVKHATSLQGKKQMYAMLASGNQLAETLPLAIVRRASDSAHDNLMCCRLKRTRQALWSRMEPLCLATSRTATGVVPTPHRLSMASWTRSLAYNCRLIAWGLWYIFHRYELIASLYHSHKKGWVSHQTRRPIFKFFWDLSGVQGLSNALAGRRGKIVSMPHCLSSKSYWHMICRSAYGRLPGQRRRYWPTCEKHLVWRTTRICLHTGSSMTLMSECQYQELLQTKFEVARLLWHI